MKAATLRRFLALHSWSGLAAGWLLFIAFYAGALTMFHHELEDWERAPPAAGAAAPDPGRLADAQRLLDQVLIRHPQAAANLQLWLVGEHAETARVNWYEPAADRRHGYTLGPDGTLVAEADREGLGRLVFQLHFTAGLPQRIGMYLFGLVCVLYGVALASGVLLYLPVFWRDLFALRLGPNLKRLWQDAHNLLGVLSLPFHVVFAWSGAVLCIGTLMLAPFELLVFNGRLLPLLQPELDPAPVVHPAGRAAPLLPLATLLQHAQAEVPAFTVQRVELQQAGDARAVATVEGEAAQGAMNRRAAVVLEAATGRVLRVSDPQRQSAGQAMLYGLMGLHFGDYGGSAVQWLYFALGLAGAVLFYSGNLLWVEARRRHRQPVQRRACVRMAQLTLGICLGCCAGVAAAFWAVRLAPGQHGWLWPAYGGVFGACVVLALALSPSRGAQALLGLNVVLHAGIPLLDLADLGRAQPSAAAAGTRLAVALVALLLAAGFAAMARAARRRARHGDPHSVWALPGRVGVSSPAPARRGPGARHTPS